MLLWTCTRMVNFYFILWAGCTSQFCFASTVNHHHPRLGRKQTERKIPTDRRRRVHNNAWQTTTLPQWVRRESSSHVHLSSAFGAWTLGHPSLAIILPCLIRKKNELGLPTKSRRMKPVKPVKNSAESKVAGLHGREGLLYGTRATILLFILHEKYDINSLVS